MQLIHKDGSPGIRLKRHMRSLWIEYPREEKKHDVLAVLFNRQDSGKPFKLPVLKADAKGLEIRLPLLLSGMFYLKIVDGDLSFLSQIALQ
jgi:hypothetical protein